MRYFLQGCGRVRPSTEVSTCGGASSSHWSAARQRHCIPGHSQRSVKHQITRRDGSDISGQAPHQRQTRTSARFSKGCARTVMSKVATYRWAEGHIERLPTLAQELVRCGIRNKAERGELRRGLPVGFVWGDEDGEVRFHPDGIYHPALF